MIKVLFVCLGNICRSPAAEGILLQQAREGGLEQRISVDSCGLGDWHLGHPPDERMREAALQRGISLTGRAKVFQKHYFKEFDYILAADQEVLQILYKKAQTPEELDKIQLITHYSTAYKGQDVPDPYYYGYGAFELVLDMLEDSCVGFINEVVDKR